MKLDNIYNNKYIDINSNDNSINNLENYNNVFSYIYNNYNYLVENILYEFFNDKFISENIVSYHQRHNYRCLDDTKVIKNIINNYKKELVNNKDNAKLLFINEIHLFIKKKVYIRIFKLTITYKKLAIASNSAYKDYKDNNKDYKDNNIDYKDNNNNIYQNLNEKLNLIDIYINLYLFKYT